MTEGNCGSYTFMTIFQAIYSFAHNGERIIKMPAPGIITSDSYLTPSQVNEIENCVNFRCLDKIRTDNSLKNLSPEIQTTEKDKKQQQNEAIQEFLIVLANYKEERKKESAFHMEKKLKAVDDLMEILEFLKKKWICNQRAFKKI